MDGFSTEQTTAILESLAAQVTGFDAARITANGIHMAKWGIADTIGVALAGVPEACTQILLKTPGVGDGPGACLVFGTGRRTSALDATFINGTASHALDFDDFSNILGGHQSVPLVAPLFALAEDRRLTGRQVIDAYVVGLEVEHRFARAVHPHHYDKGWHPTATLGIFGTVAAAAHALGSDAKSTATAFAIAASLASGIKANFGTMTKPLHVGQSARCGLLALYLAERGFDANLQAMEHHQGFLNVFNGAGTFDTAPLTGEWTDPLDIELPSLGLKQFACCGSTHHAIFGALSLAAEEDIDPKQIRKIDIGTHARRLRHTNTPFPKSVLQAKFSVQYAVARALNDRAVGLDAFSEGAYDAPEITRLLDLTTAAPLPESGPVTGIWDAEVAVTLADGRRFSRQVMNMVGRDAANPMSRDELKAKFMDCACRILDAAPAGRAFEGLMDLENQDDMAALIGLLAA